MTTFQDLLSSSSQPLVGPPLVHDPRPIRLALLHQTHALPLRHIRRIHPPSRLTAEPAPLAPGGHIPHGVHINPMARVELERGLRAGHLEMQLRVRVVRVQVHAQGLLARVQRDGLGVGDHGEAVVHVGAGVGAREDELLGGVEARVGRGTTRGDGGGVDGKVLVRGEGDLGASEGLEVRSAGEVEVGVVGQVDGRLVCAIYELGFVVDAQHIHILAVLLLGTSCVHNLGLHRARETLLTIPIRQSELNALATLKTLNTWDLPGTDWLRTLPDTLSPSRLSAVQGVAAVVVEQRPVLAVDAQQLGARDAVGYATDRLAEVGLVVGGVLLLGVEALDDVGAVDEECLDVGAEGEK